jgi:predicted enzyme related to lactoylglutathione lyase
MIRTRGVSQIQLAVTDMDRTIQFYSEVFGFEVVHRRDRRAVLQTPSDHGSLVLTHVRTSEQTRCTEFGLDLMDPADVDAALSLAEANGGAVIVRTDHAVGGTAAVIADPTGHRISL